jgi:integrase
MLNLVHGPKIGEQVIAYLRDQLGHASIKMTVDTYGHLMPSMQHHLVDPLDDDIT